MKHMLTLSLEFLNLEYIQWTTANGNGRNKKDLRFGQYLWSKYKNMDDFQDVFYTESATDAYNKLLENYYESEK